MRSVRYIESQISIFLNCGGFFHLRDSGNGNVCFCDLCTMYVCVWASVLARATVHKLMLYSKFEWHKVHGMNLKTFC